jgi:hypothetical protein
MVDVVLPAARCSELGHNVWESERTRKPKDFARAVTVGARAFSRRRAPRGPLLELRGHDVVACETVEKEEGDRG